MKIGDLLWDVVTKSLWVLTDMWYSKGIGENQYSIQKVNSMNLTIIVNEKVITYMRADFIKRSKNDLDL